MQTQRHFACVHSRRWWWRSFQHACS